MPLAASLTTIAQRLAARLSARAPAPAPPDRKASLTGPLIAFDNLRRPVWAPRDYLAHAREGFMQNAIVYRCVRMIAESTGSVPLLLYQGYSATIWVRTARQSG